jgi:hypothetical protein
MATEMVGPSHQPDSQTPRFAIETRIGARGSGSFDPRDSIALRAGFDVNP